MVLQLEALRIQVNGWDVSYLLPRNNPALNFVHLS